MFFEEIFHLLVAVFLFRVECLLDLRAVSAGESLKILLHEEIAKGLRQAVDAFFGGFNLAISAVDRSLRLLAFASRAGGEEPIPGLEPVVRIIGRPKNRLELIIFVLR